MSRSHTDVSDQVNNEACPLTEVLDHVAGKWSI